MRFGKVVRMFRRGSVCVFGMRGSGKDMLISNVVARRKEPYVSNVPYGGKHIPLDMAALDIHNTHHDFMAGCLQPYSYPYKDGTDVYISDVGVYLPSQYCTDLNKAYPQFPLFLALSRQLGQCNVHINTQSLGRAWDKLREQSEIYVRCRWCKVLFGGRVVVQGITTYDRADSALNNVPQYPTKLFKGFGTVREIYEQQKRTYLINYGNVKNRLLLYINKGQYDTRYFKTLLGAAERTNDEEMA